MKTIAACFFVFVCLWSFTLSAQPVVRMELKDSLAMQEGQRLVTQQLHIQNLLKTNVSFEFSVHHSPGWKLINAQKNIKLTGGEKTVIPLILVPDPTEPSVWSAVHINLKRQGGSDELKDSFFVKPPSILRYNALLQSRYIDLHEQPKEITTAIYLSNTGNEVNKIKLQLRNAALQLNSHTELELLPFSDTLLHIPLSIPAFQLKKIVKETIVLRLTDKAGQIKSFYIDIDNRKSKLKQHASPFQTIPVEIENGYLKMGKDLSYFAGLRGRLQIGDKKYFHFSYRSREYGLNNQLQSHNFQLNYSTEKWQLFAGQTTEAGNFISYGNGIRVKHALREDVQLTMAATLHNKNAVFKNDNLEVGANINKTKLFTQHTIAYNADREAMVNSFIVKNNIGYVFTPALRLQLTTAAGMEKFSSNRDRYERPGIATGLGYQFSFRPSNWQLLSRWEGYDKFYPGLNRGMQTHHHLASVNVGKVQLGIFYQANRSQPTIFRDTLYNTDMLSYNSARYGASAHFNFRKSTLALSGGKLQQSGDEASFTTYKFGDVNYALRAGRSWAFRFNTINGFDRIKGKLPQTVWLTNSNISLFYKSFGISGIFTSVPLLLPDTSGIYLSRYDQTLHLAPSVSFSMWKRFSFGLNYNLSKSIYDDNVTSFVGYRLFYGGKHNGVTISFNGSVPVTQSKADVIGLSREYYSLSLLKKIQFPVFFNKKYVSLKVQVFEDRNDNGMMDEEEPALRDVLIQIGGIPFITSSRGRIEYKNLERGLYKIDLSAATDMKGLIPAQGLLQSFRVDKDAIMLIPFKKGKVITGTISVQIDSLSTLRFTPAGIKVLARDQAGNIFSALADANGKFSINVPSGRFSVSLNPEAFNDKIKPEVMVQAVDLLNAPTQEVNFLIRQQKRRINLLKTN